MYSFRYLTECETAAIFLSAPLSFSLAPILRNPTTPAQNFQALRNHSPDFRAFLAP